MSNIQLKIDSNDRMLKHISLIRKFDPALSISAIKHNIERSSYVINHDLYAYDLVEEIMGIERTVRFRQKETDRALENE